MPQLEANIQMHVVQQHEQIFKTLVIYMLVMSRALSYRAC
jgi:hypothetical protein